MGDLYIDTDGYAVPMIGDLLDGRWPRKFRATDQFVRYCGTIEGDKVFFSLPKTQALYRIDDVCFATRTRRCTLIGES